MKENYLKIFYSSLLVFLISLNLLAQNNNIETLYEQANKLYNKFDYNEASKIYNQIIKLDPEYAKAYYGLGSVFYVKKDYNSAIEYYNKAIEKDNKFSQAYEWLGNAYAKQKKYDSALEYWKKSFEINKNNNNLKQLIDKFSKQIQTKQKEIDNIIKISSKLNLEGYFDKAVNILENGAKMYPESEKLLFNLSRLYFSRMKYKDTLNTWIKLVTLNKPIVLSELLQSQELINLYLEEVDAMVSMFPKNITVYEYAGLIYGINTDYYQRASYLLNQAIILGTKNNAVYIKLGEIYSKIQKKESAINIYKKLLEYDNNIEANYQLGIFYLYDKVDIETAKQYFKKVEKINSNYKNIKDLLNYIEKL
jgi:tetratricopeptide (TPR) repeat protein